MQEATSSFRWLQTLAIAHACLSLGVVPVVGLQILRSDLVLGLLLQGALAAVVAIALVLHYRWAIQMAFGLSLLVVVLGLVAMVALPVPSGMMGSTFLFIRGMVLLLFLPSLGSVLVCLLARGLRHALFRSQ